MNEADPRVSSLVTNEMESLVLHQGGLLRALRAEAGPLVIIGLALMVVTVALSIRSLGMASALVLALALVPGVSLLGVAMWLSRADPKPLWLLIRCVLWGAGPAIFVAGVINSFVSGLDGLSASTVVSAPIVEEAMKGLALLWILRHHRAEIHGRLDAVVYAICVGLGFGMVENIQYYSEALRNVSDVLASTIIGRGIFSPFAHPVFTSATAIGIAAAAHRKGIARIVLPLLGYLCAVSLHSLWNGTPGFEALVIPVFIGISIQVVQASRRHETAVRAAIEGAVTRGELPGEALDLVRRTTPRRFRDWAAAAVDPQHPLYELWRRRHLAWLVTSPRAAAQLAEDDPAAAATPAQVQAAACALLRQRLQGAVAA